jgi:hypothetical protein
VTGALVGAGQTAVYGNHNSERLPVYLRLDVGYRRALKRSWFGRDGEIVPYVQVLNVLGMHNVLWASPSSEVSRSEPRLTSQLPFLPTVGFEWHF